MKKSTDKPSGLGDDHLGAQSVEFAPKIAVVQRNFDVLVRSLIDARRCRGSGRRRQHVPRHAGRHGAGVVAAAEWTALTCAANCDRYIHNSSTNSRQIYSPCGMDGTCRRILN